MIHQLRQGFGRAARALMALTVASVAAVTISATPASADDLDWVVPVRNAQTGLYLDTNSNDVYTHTRASGGQQYWRWTMTVTTTTTQYQIKSYAYGGCLDSNYAGDVYLLGCNGGNYQRWAKVDAGGAFYIVNMQTGRCLDSNYAGEVYTLNCNLGNYQKWYEN
ncbi:RICIN domain-containing protein [Streptomyces sp. NPDC049687]|uniref:RICIN domain-containing protein n=1 Tax=Streptomyces sp. NPDC049687 TaxID=3365596 RepID=UPI0037A4F2A8